MVCVVLQEKGETTQRLELEQWELQFLHYLPPLLVPPWACKTLQLILKAKGERCDERQSNGDEQWTKQMM